MFKINNIHQIDCSEGLMSLPDKSVDCCITSPPYWGLRNYRNDNQIGLEKTPKEYVEKLTSIFIQVKRVLKDDGTLWLNLGDTYARTGGTDRKVSSTAKVGSTKNTLIQMGERKSKSPIGYKDKDLIGIPWMLAFALRDSGYYLREDIIWYKPNAMPESVRDRCTRSHEYLFHFSISKKYYHDANAIKNEITNSNKRSVWTVPTKPFKEAHFATFPETLINDCVKASCPIGGVVLDPFMGAGTTALVAKNNGRNYLGFELNEDYIKIAQKRLQE